MIWNSLEQKKNGLNGKLSNYTDITALSLKITQKPTNPKQA